MEERKGSTELRRTRNVGERQEELTPLWAEVEEEEEEVVATAADYAPGREVAVKEPPPLPIRCPVARMQQEPSLRPESSMGKCIEKRMKPQEQMRPERR